MIKLSRIWNFFGGCLFNFLKRIEIKKLIGALCNLMSRRSILPASMFSKKQVEWIDNMFEEFWNGHLNEGLVRPKGFSTFTLGKPKSLWSFYFPTRASHQLLLKSYEVRPFSMSSYDSTDLHGAIFKKNKTNSATSRVLIIFGGNGELFKIGSAGWIFSLLMNCSIDFDIVMFDPRECGKNRGIASAQAMIRDGKAIVEFIQKELKVSIDQIDFCGFSLGAAIATHVKSFYPKSAGALISNRSFQSLESAIKGIFDPLGPLFSKVFGKLAWKIAEENAWKLTPLGVWDSIKGPKMVICHPNDPIIRHGASLEKGLHDLDLLQDCLHVQLNQKNPLERIKNHHVQPLSSYNDQSGQDALALILQFLAHRNELKSQDKS